jgi:hypothetical protein
VTHNDPDITNDYESPGEVASTDKRSSTENWRHAFIGSFVVHVIWIGVLIWYVKFPDSIFCVVDENEGFINFSWPVCPEERPFRGQVTLLLVVFGSVLSLLTGMYAGRVGLHLASIIYLGVLLPIPAAMLCLIYLGIT